jgi:hypothetical protein
MTNGDSNSILPYVEPLGKVELTDNGGPPPLQKVFLRFC